MNGGTGSKVSFSKKKPSNSNGRDKQSTKNKPNRKSSNLAQSNLSELSNALPLSKKKDSTSELSKPEEEPKNETGRKDKTHTPKPSISDPEKHVDEPNDPSEKDKQEPDSKISNIGGMSFKNGEFKDGKKIDGEDGIEKGKE